MDSPKPNKTPCPKCGNPLRLGGLAAGEVVRCPKCSTPITIGGGTGSPQPAKRPLESPAKPSGAKRVESALVKQTRKPTVEEPLVIDGSGPPQVVPVNPFVDRQPGELPIAKPAAASDAFDDDDVYEPEIPLIPSQIPEQPFIDAKLGTFAEQRREVAPGVSDDLQVERHTGSGADPAEMHLESAKRRGLVRHFMTPDPPKWTFFSGIVDFPWRGPNLARWTMMAVGLSTAVGLSYAGMSMLGLFHDQLSMNALGGVFVGALAVAFDVVVLSLVSACCQTALQDTADGYPSPQEHTMPELGQWIFIAFSWLMLGTAAAAIGFPLSLAIGPVAFAITLWVFFPFLLLSSLETESVLMPFSLPVFRSLGYQFGAWVMFYLLTTLMAAVVGVAAYYSFGFSPFATCLLGGPVLATVTLLYARLLGRLAWKASGSRMAQIELSGTPEDAAVLAEAAGLELASNKTKAKRRSRVRIVIPDEQVPREPDGEAPRIKFHHPR